MDFQNEHKIQIKLSQMIRGKAPTSWGKEDWARYHSSFRLTETTPRGLATAIWQGFSFTPVFRHRRTEENFTAAYHLALDFDAGDKTSSLDYLMRDGSFCWTFASFGYSTPSSSDTKPKSRVVFIFDEPITEPDRFRAVYQAVSWMVAQDGSHSDPACKDPLRLYYGSPDCKVVANWSVLPGATIDFILEQYAAAHPVVTQPVLSAAPIAQPAQYSPKFLEGIMLRLCDNIRNAPDGERHAARLGNARAAGGYVAAGFFTRSDVEAMLCAAAVANTDNAEGAQKTIMDGVEYGMASPLYPSTPADLIRPIGDIL
jgi:hypothetical protein